MDNGAASSTAPPSTPISTTRHLLLYLLHTVLSMAAVGTTHAETAAALRALPFLEASAGKPVTLSGTVTYLRDIPSDFNFSVQDPTGGIMVYPETRTPLTQGQRVTVQGVTAISVHGLRITRATVLENEPGTLPEPIPATMSAIREGQHEGQFVTVEGLLRAVRLESPEVQPQRLALDFGPRSQRLTVWISTYPHGIQQFAPGSKLRCRGVVVRWKNPRGQPQSVNILANHETDITTLSAATQPPLTRIADAQSWNQANDMATPTKIRGAVTLSEPDQGWLVIQEDQHAIRVRTANQRLSPTIGETVEAVGFPVLGHYTMELEDAAIIPADPINPVIPAVLANASQALAGLGLLDRDARLVRINSAQVHNLRESDLRHLLELSSGTHTFTASWPQSQPVPETVRIGSSVELTGILSLTLSDERRRLGKLPDTFRLHLRGTHDIRVIASGPWWTPQRLRLALFLTAALAALLVLWSASLRRKNRILHEAMQARQRAEHELASERRRVANQLHDTLQQTLTAASLQLHAATRLMPPNAHDASSAVSIAQELMHRGRDEVRDAVWDLGTDDQASVHLGHLLQRLIGEMNPRSASLIHYSRDADPTLPAHIATQIVRIVREALTNAVKHAGASTIRVSLASTDDQFTLSITDNGRGFDPAAAATPDEGNFGLSSMMERSARIGARLHVHSQINSGTTIELNFTRQSDSPPD